MKNKTVLLLIVLVVHQSAIFAQDKYFPIYELAQLFEAKTVSTNTVDEFVPKANTLALENQNLVQISPTQVYTFAQIEFVIPQAGDAIIGVYDSNDNKVKSVAFNHFEAGTYKKTIQTRNLAKGVYYVKLQMDGYTEIQRLIVVQ